MALSVLAPITAGDICRVKMFKELKVYLLSSSDGSEIVIKTDAVFDAQIKSAGTIAKAIDPAIKMKILTANELNELRDYVRFFEEYRAMVDELGARVGWVDTQRDAVDKLGQSLGFGFPFAKMSKQTIHNIEDAATARGTGDKSIVGDFVTSLRADGGLEKLGQVVAADLFNGNTDRFMPDSNERKTVGPYTFDFKTLVNAGNVMIVADGAGGFTASLLDYVDPQSQFKDMNISLAIAENGGNQWPGRVLVDKTRRKKYAKDIISDLEKLLNPKKHRLSLSTKLGSNASTRLEAGMVAGAQMIRNRLEVKFNPNRWTPGARDRHTLLSQVRA